MGHFYFLVGLGIFVLLAFALSIRRGLKARLRLPYLVEEAFFSRGQRVFKEVLERAVGREYQVYGKVRAADLIRLRPRLSRAERERALDRLDGRRFDFVICARATSSVVCAVNLAPKSRLRKHAPKDALDRICAAAGLPFVRLRERESYAVDEIGDLVSAAIHSRGAAPASDEIASDEAASVLHRLGAAIEDEPRLGQSSSGPTSAGLARPPHAGSDRPPEPLEPGPQSLRPRRREPVIQDHQVVDDGPRFRIEGDLDDERPSSTRRR